MTEERLEAGLRLQRRARSGSDLSSRAGLSWGFGLLEGAAASLVLFLPALAYHLLVIDPRASSVLWLYAVSALAVGLVYGCFSATAASRYVDRPPQPQALVADAAYGWSASVALLLLAAFLFDLAGDLSRVSIASAYVIGLPLLTALRAVAHAQVVARIRAGRLQYVRIAVAGARADVARFVAYGALRRRGYAVADSFALDEFRDRSGRLRAGTMHELGRRALAAGADTFVLVGSLENLGGIAAALGELRRLAINVDCAPVPTDDIVKFLDVVPLGSNNGVRVLRKPMGDGAVLLKRAFDLVGAAIGLALLSPLFAVIALLIKLDAPGPVFYRQERRGFNGESFYIWKFRSMSVTESGRQMVQARRGDPRITRVGRFMRPLNIDELPQLLNVLFGEMSLVGPRPHAIQHDDELGHVIASYAHRQRIKPGITGWAQVNGYRGETTTLAQIEGRTRFDLAYIENWSLLFDCWILILTVFSPKARHNAV